MREKTRCAGASAMSRGFPVAEMQAPAQLPASKQLEARRACWEAGLAETERGLAALGGGQAGPYLVHDGAAVRTSEAKRARFDLYSGCFFLPRRWMNNFSNTGR